MHASRPARDVIAGVVPVGVVTTFGSPGPLGRGVSNDHFRFPRYPNWPSKGFESHPFSATERYLQSSGR